MRKILSIFNSNNLARGFLGCLVLLLITESVVRLQEHNLMSATDALITIRKSVLEQKEPLNYQALIIGDSRAVGINAKLISQKISEATGTEFRVYNFSIPNHGVRGYYLFLKKYLKNHKKPEYIFFMSSPMNMTGEMTVQKGDGRSKTHHRMCHLYSTAELFSVMPLNIFLTSLTIKLERLSHLILLRGRIQLALEKPKIYFADYTQAIINTCTWYNGAAFLMRNIKMSTPDVRRVKYYDWPLYPDEESIKWIEKLFQLAKERDIKIIGINTPIYEGILNNRDRDGSNKRYEQVVQKWRQQYDNLTYIDPLLEPYPLQYFGDWQHLNMRGLVKFTEDLAMRLSQYINRTP